MALLGELSFGETRPQSLVAVDAAVAILDALWRATHDGADILRLTLEGVVVHGENFLVVVLP